jgi:3-dehydroquinate dehydratase II
MTKAIYVINGPNLNRLGKRVCQKAAGEHPVEFRQSNAEHQIVDWIHEAIDKGVGIVINPAGLTFTSIPILDALKMFPGPVFELHITNVHRREQIYQHSLVSKVATAVIMGLGPDGYRAAVEAMVRRLGGK